MLSITSELTQKILKDITTSELSSYQIAFKYQVSKTIVDSIGRKNLGEVIYKKKETFAFQKLNNLITDSLNKGNSITATADNLGVCRSTMFKLAHSIRSVTPNQVQVISVKHPEQNLAVSAVVEPAADDKENEVAMTEDRSVVREGRMPVRYRPYQKRGHRFNRGSHNDYARIVINGVQLSFDPHQEQIFITVNKIVELMKSEGV